MIRALHRGDVSGSAVYVNVGGLTNLAIAEGKTCVFTRVIPYGIESVAGDLAERRGLTLEHAHGWLKHVGMLSPVEEIEGDAEIVVEARSVLTDGVRRIGDEVRNSLDFHVMQDGSTPVERVVLTGPAIAIPGFAEHIGQQIGLSVDVGVVAEGKAGAFGGVDGGRLAIAAGLAVDEVPA
jgi:type IV pilus assembly protein PilM